MKRLRFILLVLWGIGPFGAGAQTADTLPCRDVVYLKDGSVFRGKILSYDQNGELSMQSWSGAAMKISSQNVKKVVQKCEGEQDSKPKWEDKPYSFKENGWYHATRAAILPGDDGMGFGLQHSSGYQFSRLFGAGIGTGFENFKGVGANVPTYPLFAELRGYLLPKHISPFYTLGFGWGFSNKDRKEVVFENAEEHWRGGWMAQGQLGYRLGNHATFHAGIRLQHKTLDWSYSTWIQSAGTNQILHKRFDLGFGLLF